MPQVTIDLPDFTSENFQDALMAAVADRLLVWHTMGDGESENGYRVSSELRRKLETHMADVIREQAREFAPEVAREILDQGIPRTNTWGDVEGTPVPLKTVIAEEVKKGLSHHSGSRGEGTLSKLLREEVQGQLRGELAAIIAEAKAPILEAVRKEAEGAIEGALKTALSRVRS